jgi:hypothetical protein
METKKEKKYGVFVNIHPSGKNKRVTIHKLPCFHYKQHLKRGKASNIYTFHKDCSTFEAAISKASEWSLNWHAELKICKGCRWNWNLS